jgi:hypothetical protein
MNTDEDITLDTSWNLYFHDYMDSSWDRESYEIIGTVKTVIQFWTMFNIIKSKLDSGMFFLMREGVFPKWDDNINKTFSFLTIKVTKQSVISFAESLFVRMINNSIITNNKLPNTVIDGVSVSPKKNFCIFKLWICSEDEDHKDITLYDIPNSYTGSVFFKDYSQ